MDDETSRLTDLETRIAFLEHLLDKLNDVVTQQQDQLDAQASEIIRLRDQLETPSDDIPQNERPPHY